MTIHWSQIFKLRYLRIIFVNSLGSTLILIILSINGVFEFAELDVFDHFVRQRPERGVDPNIVLVGVTEPDIQYLGEWPISDRKLTQILKAIKNQDPAVIGLDLIRDLPVLDGASELEAFFRSTPNRVVGK